MLDHFLHIIYKYNGIFNIQYLPVTRYRSKASFVCHSTTEAKLLKATHSSVTLSPTDIVFGVACMINCLMKTNALSVAEKQPSELQAVHVR